MLGEDPPETNGLTVAAATVLAPTVIVRAGGAGPRAALRIACAANSIRRAMAGETDAEVADVGAKTIARAIPGESATVAAGTAPTAIVRAGALGESDAVDALDGATTRARAGAAGERAAVLATAGAGPAIARFVVIGLSAIAAAAATPIATVCARVPPGALRARGGAVGVDR